MSALCQKRTFCATVKTSLFNHLVSDAKQSRREAEAECLGGFEVDYQLEFGWLLDRQIGWLGAFENAIDVPCRVAEFFGAIISIGNQAARFRKKAVAVDS